MRSPQSRGSASPQYGTSARILTGEGAPAGGVAGQVVGHGVALAREADGRDVFGVLDGRLDPDQHDVVIDRVTHAIVLVHDRLQMTPSFFL